MSLDPKVEAYLDHIRAHLGGANANEEEVVVRLITARIHALLNTPGSTIDSAIELLGPAAIVAQQYRDAELITRAAWSNSPLLLLHASLRNGIAGALAFLVGLLGYWFGGGIVVFGTLALVWSAFHYHPNAKAAIGSSMFIDVLIIAAGLAVLALATVLMRLLLRSSSKVRIT